jgi:hypothetical protein
MRGRYIWYRGDWVPISQFKPVKRLGPMIMRDIDPYRCVVDGEMITSRSRHRDKLRETGCVEWGTEKPKPHHVELAPVEPDIKQAVEMVRAGHKPRALDSGVIPE